MTRPPVLANDARSRLWWRRQPGKQQGLRPGKKFRREDKLAVYTQVHVEKNIVTSQQLSQPELQVK